MKDKEDSIVHLREQMSSVQSRADANPKSNGGVTRRLIRGFGAMALSPIVTAIIQLGSVPLLLHAWGAAKYGDWLLLSAIPSYLTLSDLGFGDASGSDMSMRVAGNDREGALETFQSSWVLVTVVSLVALLLAASFAWWIPWQPWLKLSGISNAEAAKILVLLSAYVAVSQQNSVAESGYRSDGHFATGTFWGVGVLRLTETAAATIVALAGGTMVAVACTYLCVRCLATIAYALLLRRLCPWIQFGIRHARLRTIKRMAAPALGFIAFPLGHALTLQGFTIVIGARLGPIAVVSFSTLRTLSRLSLQLTTMIKHTLWPELSRAFGEGNISLARTLHRHACRASLGLSILIGLLLWMIGPFIYRIWLGQGISFDATCFHVLLFVAIANSLWDTSAVIPMSINGHSRIAVMYSGAALLSLGVAGVLIPSFGTVGAAVALLVADGCMTVPVLRAALGHTEDSLKNFLAARFVFTSFRQILRTAREA
jgi:O-antigen/teichoic acid export membrane protein